MSTSSGAKNTTVNWQARLQAFLLEHRRNTLQSLRRLKNEPVNTMITCLVIAIALALPVSLYVAMGNLQALSGRWEGESQISVFLKAELDEAQAQVVAADIQKWPEIQRVKVISKAQGLAEFQQLTGMQEVLAQLEKNPLPVVLEVLPNARNSGAAAAALLLKRLQTLPQTDMAKLDLEWVKRLEALLQLGQRIAFILVLMLSLGVLLVIGNTIRLEIEARRREIEVVTLIGGTEAFIRRPFLYAGFWYGLGGGVLASAIVMASLAALNPTVARLAGLYDSDYALLALSLSDTLSLWMLAALLGYAGAWFAVAKHLDALQPGR